MQARSISLRAVSIAALLASSAFAASAQTSTVTVYGVVDMYLQYAKGTKSVTSIESGGLSGSRLGFKGAEDLGGGLKTIFQLEMGINADNGSSGQGGLAFGRQAYVGLSSSELGTLTLGRQYNPQFNVLDTFDPFATGAGSAASSGIVTTVARANNAVVYQSPSIAGFSASALVSLGESSTTPKTTGNQYSLGAQYVAGPFSAGLAWREAKRDATHAEDSTFTLLTAAYDFGSFSLTGGAQSVRNLGGVATADRTEAFAGVLVPVSANGTVNAGVGYGKTKDVDGTAASQYSLGYTHALSKRTKVYTVLTHIRNGDATAYTSDSATGAGPATTAGQNVSGVQFGIRHAF